MSDPSFRHFNPKVVERFWSKVEKTGGCWNWKGGTGGKPSNIYGRFCVFSSRPKHIKITVQSHRYSYELLKGPIPEGKTLDHLCRNTLCVNPSHLEPVTTRENIMRGVGIAPTNAKKLSCPKGHPLVEGNLVAYRLEKGHRLCLTCARERSRFQKRRELGVKNPRVFP